MRRLLTLLIGLLAIAAISASAAARPLGPNGQIAFDRSDGVYLANADGGGEHLLVPNSCCSGWSPDGSKLAAGYQLDDGRIGTATIGADGLGYTQLPIDDPTLNLGCGFWSPDGARLACETWDDTTSGRNGVYTISSADGSGLTRITANPLGGHDIPGSFSPDGTRIVFTRADANGDNVGLFVVKTNVRQVRQITPDGTILNIGADWSPQGNEIIFSRHVTPDVRGSLWVLHANGTGLHEIHIQGLDCGGSVFDPIGIGCHGPHWSPDGTRIIFVANSPATGQNLYTANADGTGLSQGANDGDDDNPVWGTHPAVPYELL